MQSQSHGDGSQQGCARTVLAFIRRRALSWSCCESCASTREWSGCPWFECNACGSRACVEIDDLRHGEQYEVERQEVGGCRRFGLRRRQHLLERAGRKIRYLRATHTHIYIYMLCVYVVRCVSCVS